MDKEQFIRTVAQEQESLRRFLRVLCGGDSFRADDIAQEALLKAYLSFEKFQGRAKFSTWLFRIAYNCWYDSARTSSAREAVSLDEVGSDRPDDSADAAAGFQRQDLRLAVSALSEAERIVVLLFYMEDKTVKDIEAITGMPSGTVRSHLFRARKHLREYLDRLGYGRP